jgi:signal transduction histidine kinase
MKARLTLRIAAPILAIGFVPLVVVLFTVWKVHRSQKNISYSLASNIPSMRAAEELAIDIRDVRIQLDRYLISGERRHLEAVSDLRHESDHWLEEAELYAVTPQEQEMIARVKKGYFHFFGEWERLMNLPPDEDFPRRVRELNDDALTNEILLPAQEYLDFNENQIAESNEDNQRLTDWMLPGLSLLGICGPASGLLVGFGITRGLQRSIVRLSVPIRDAAGKLNEIVGPISFSADWGLDELEGVLRRIAAQIGAVIERLQKSQREVLRAEQLAAVGQMAAGIAHEVRNPLMSMKLLVQAAAARGSSAGLEGRDLTVLEEEITRLERSIRTLLDFARPPQLEKRTFEVTAMLAQLVDLVSSRAAQLGVQIETEWPNEPVVMQADVGQLRQVVLNLLLNALDAVSEGGVIGLYLSSVSTAPGLSLSVFDSGCGLPSELGQQIFEPFVSTKETGIGLGLSICKRIVEAHGGTIEAADRPEGGALFTVRVPLLTPETAAHCEGEGTDSREGRLRRMRKRSRRGKVHAACPELPSIQGVKD